MLIPTIILSIFCQETEATLQARADEICATTREESDQAAEEAIEDFVIDCPNDGQHWQVIIACREGCIENLKNSFWQRHQAACADATNIMGLLNADLYDAFEEYMETGDSIRYSIVSGRLINAASSDLDDVEHDLNLNLELDVVWAQTCMLGCCELVPKMPQSTSQGPRIDISHVVASAIAGIDARIDNLCLTDDEVDDAVDELLDGIIFECPSDGHYIITPECRQACLDVFTAAMRSLFNEACNSVNEARETMMSEISDANNNYADCLANQGPSCTTNWVNDINSALEQMETVLDDAEGILVNGGVEAMEDMTDCMADCCERIK